MTEEIMKPFEIQVITTLIDVLVDGKDQYGETVGRYRSGSDLEMYLGNANIELNLESNSRKTATRKALIQANNLQPDSVAKVIEQVTDPR